MALFVRNHSRFAKSPDDLCLHISLLAYRSVFIYCDGDLQQINRWLDDSAKTEGLVRLAYEADCIKRGIAPGSDLNPDS